MNQHELPDLPDRPRGPEGPERRSWLGDLSPRTATTLAALAVLFPAAAAIGLLAGSSAEPGSSSSDSSSGAASGEPQATLSLPAAGTSTSGETPGGGGLGGSEGEEEVPAPDEGEGASSSEANEAADNVASQDVATRFVGVWALPGIGRPPWLQQLQPLASPAMFELLTYTDLALVPTDLVVGARSLGVEYLDGVGAQGLVLVDLASGSTVQVWTQQQTTGTWVVTGIEPADAGGPQEGP